MKDKVKLLHNERTEDTFAFFPELPEWTEDNLKELDCTEASKESLRQIFTSYSVVGQHSACCLDYANESRNATPEESEGLIRDLKAVGYDIEIIQ